MRKSSRPKPRHFGYILLRQGDSFLDEGGWEQELLKRGIPDENISIHDTRKGHDGLSSGRSLLSIVQGSPDSITFVSFDRVAQASEDGEVIIELLHRLDVSIKYISNAPAKQKKTWVKKDIRKLVDAAKSSSSIEEAATALKTMPHDVQRAAEQFYWEVTGQFFTGLSEEEVWQWFCGQARDREDFAQACAQGRAKSIAQAVHAGKPWTRQETRHLANEVALGLPLEKIALDHSRTLGAIESRIKLLIPKGLDLPVGRRECMKLAAHILNENDGLINEGLEKLYPASHEGLPE